MSNIRRLWALALSLLLLSSCGAAPVDSSDQPEPESEPWENAQVFLSFATSQKNQMQRLEEISANISDASQGLIFCNAYTGEQFGGDDSLLTAVRKGAISIVQMSTAPQARVIPELALLDTPLLFSNAAECEQALHGPLLDFFQPFYNREGLQLLSWHCAQFRQLSSVFPVEGPSDLKRLHIRILDNKYHQLYWSALGAQTEIIPFSDLFYAAQQGIVNAQDNPPNSRFSLSMYQFFPYILQTGHVPFISCVVMNKDCYDQLSPSEQKALAQVFYDDYDTYDVATPTTELLRLYRRIDTPSPQLNEAFLAASQTVREALREDLGAEVTDAFYALLEEE